MKRSHSFTLVIFAILITGCGKDNEVPKVEKVVSGVSSTNAASSVLGLNTTVNAF